jgi:hypothetical protein
VTWAELVGWFLIGEAAFVAGALLGVGANALKRRRHRSFTRRARELVNAPDVEDVMLLLEGWHAWVYLRHPDGTYTERRWRR